MHKILKLSVVFAAWTFCAFAADNYSTTQVKQMPSLAMRREGKGTLKVCSKPLELTVSFNGQTLKKNRAVLTVDDVQPGLYDVVFTGGGRQLVKKARIVPGETTIVFGSLDSPEAASPGVQPYQNSAVVAEDPQAVLSEPLPAAPVPAETGVAVTGLSGSGAVGLTDTKGAQIAFEYARLLQTAFNPFTASKRYHKALDLYRRVWEKYPDSPYVEMAHYYSGRINESMHIKNFAGAVEQYRTVLVINPQTQTDAAQRIASIYGDELRNHAQNQLTAMPSGGAQTTPGFTVEIDQGLNTGNSVTPVAPTGSYSSQGDAQNGYGGVTLQP